MELSLNHTQRALIVGALKHVMTRNLVRYDEHTRVFKLLTALTRGGRVPKPKRIAARSSEDK